MVEVLNTEENVEGKSEFYPEDSRIIEANVMWFAY
ncbi:hypothetical protein NIES4071_103090 (plasmid) [Calothrix sp. NIES-4071]|nr:hypothetical protein NIES4071_103090 [Calothrix sp. NIES-4071]BAZ64690.1 hypothetical protein NIES4105_104230 [Calothrix sp. NIES-4105]